MNFFAAVITVSLAVGLTNARAEDGATTSKVEFPIDAQSSTAEISAMKTETQAPQKFSPNRSLFYYMPPVEMTEVRINYSQSSLKDSRNNPNVSGTDSELKVANYDFSLTYSFDEATTAFLNAGFQSSETLRPNDSSRYNVANGMSDIFIGGQKLSKGEKTNWVYGGTLGIPPESRVTYGTDSNSEANVSSGKWSLNPYFGNETSFAGGIAGFNADISVFLYSQEKLADGNTYGRWFGEGGNTSSMNPIYAVSLYYEFVVAKPVKLGVTAGLIRNDQESKPGDAWTNERQAKFYGEGRVWEDIYVSGSLGAHTFDYGTARTMTTAQVGLKKLL